MKIKQVIKYFILWPVITLLILVVILRLSLLPLVETSVNNWLEQQGVESSIDELTLDIKSAKLSMSGLKAEKNGVQVLGIDHVGIAWSWSALLENEVSLLSVIIDGATFDYEREPNGNSVIAGIDLSKLSATNEATPESADSPNADPLAWSVRLQRFEMSKLHVCYRVLPAHDYCNHIEELDWEGLLSLDLAAMEDSTIPLQAKGKFTLTGAIIHNNRLDRNLLGLKHFSIGKLHIDTLDKISSESILLEQLTLLERSADASIPQVSKLEKLQINQFKLEGLISLDINEINLHEHEVILISQADKQMEINEWFDDTAFSGDASESGESESQASGELDFTIGKLSYQTSKSIQYRGNNSDQTVVIDINTIEFLLQDLDSKNPDQQSNISFSANYGENGRISLKGTAKPLMEKKSFNLVGKIESVDLRSLSGLSREAIGHTIKTGQLDADLKIVANKNILNSEIDITLQHFDIEAASAEDEKSIDAKLGFPLNTSLSLIKDKNNQISLSNSITGDLDNPDFDPNEAIVQAITAAVAESVLSFYTGFGLISLDDGKLSLGTALKFKPVIFDGGAADITKAGAASLEIMAELMNERLGLHMTLCAFTNTEDRLRVIPRTANIAIADLELDSEQLARMVKLGEKRESEVRDYLFEKKIAPDRLVPCDARHEEGEGLAGVDISI